MGNSSENRLSPDQALNDLLIFDAYRPGLQAGQYRLVLSHSVAVGEKENHHYFRDQKLQVRGPRFGFQPGDVHACFPPQRGRGPYHTNLPHVVFRKRSIPWERRLTLEKTRPCPWLALVLLNDRERREIGKVRRTVTFADLNPHGNDATSPILGPTLLHEGEDLARPIAVVDLSVSAFTKLLPSLKSLELSAHVRCVAYQQKASLDMHAPGEFSLLMANRLPSEGSNLALVISLEGLEPYFDGSTAIPKHVTHVRLVNLFAWEFVCDETGHQTLQGVVDQLDLDTFGQTADIPEARIADRLRQGYVPLSYKPRHDQTSFAWYRGPFSAMPIGAKQIWKPIRHADDALLQDPETGVLDMSFAAAWQLGRLLALSSGTFSSGLRRFVASSRSATEVAQRLVQFLKEHGQSVHEPEEEAATMADQLLDWLARLVLLYPVPFHYLIADPSLLPAHAMRFFYLDPRWLAALASGALSTSIQSVEDWDANLDDRFLMALSKVVGHYRRKQLGLEQKEHAFEHLFSETVSGFLIKSELVSHWPGLEIEVHSDKGSSAEKPILLRLDHLDGDLMLGLVHGRIRSLRLVEPREGLRFGLSETGAITPRKPQEKNGMHYGEPVPNIEKQFALAQASPGMLDLAKLAQQFAQNLDVPAAEFGSGLLALQLMVKPQVCEIVWP